MNQACKQKWARLKRIVQERSQWADQIASLKRMRQWVLDAEQILDGSWAKPGEPLSNQKVGRRFDRWRKQLARSLAEGTWTPVEQACLKQFLHVLENLRPHLILCYDREKFPRTNNDMEGSIRGLKTPIVALAAGRIGTAICCAPAGVCPIMIGGNSKHKDSKSFWKQASG